MPKLLEFRRVLFRSQKQAAKRYYGSHQYFTKRAWNVVQTYIRHYTREGDIVCDPYGGSGVTVTEALILGRKGIYLDISPWARFLAEQVAVTRRSGQPIALFRAHRKGRSEKDKSMVPSIGFRGRQNSYRALVSD